MFYSRANAIRIIGSHWDKYGTSPTVINSSDDRLSLIANMCRLAIDNDNGPVTDLDVHNKIGANYPKGQRIAL